MPHGHAKKNKTSLTKFSPPSPKKQSASWPVQFSVKHTSQLSPSTLKKWDQQLIFTPKKGANFPKFIQSCNADIGPLGEYTDVSFQ